MRGLFPASSMILVVALCAVQQLPRSFFSSSAPFQQWQRYTAQGEEFSVTLPALPAMRTHTFVSRNPQYTRTERMLGSYGAGVAYAIRTYDNPQNQSLQQFIEYERTRLSGLREWKEATDISIKGISGKQFQLSERNVPGAVQFFRTKKHLYQFEAFGAFISDPRVQEFFTSIALGKNVGGVEVTDGNGAQPDVQNQSEPVVSAAEVDQKVVVVSKPQPSYTESARQAHTKGTVVLKVVFASTGVVTDVEVLKGLPSGLTEESIHATKGIRFVPAMKNGQSVSVRMQLEYNFLIY